MFPNFFFTTICIASVSVLVKSTTVQTENGILSGSTYTTVEGKEVIAFLGVPYAQPPIGKFRFKEPQPLKNWEGVRTAHTFSSKCAQINYYNRYSSAPVVGEEDCLYLDIYLPRLTKGAKLDVIFFIHGGGFMFSSGHDFLPDFILQRYSDVVYVSINYRLGPFGFLTTEDDVIPGNLGLKDQVQALKWVRNNIENFGGDKDKITLIGLAAGGSSVHFHYLSPLSKNMFQKGISISGSAFNPWAMAENSGKKAQILAKSLGCPEDDSTELLNCLRKEPAESILLQTKKLFMPWQYNPFSPFGAVVENPSESSFLSENPYELLKRGDVKDAPWLTSVTTEEGLFPASYFIMNETLLGELDSKWNRIAPLVLDYKFTVPYDELLQVNEKVKKFYLGEQKISRETRKQLIQMFSDRLFVVDVERAARMQAAVTSSPVYLYSFGYRGKFSITNVLCNCRPPEHLGASHGDDSIYVMNNLFGTSPFETQEDREMVDTMTRVWMSFVKNGTPSVGKDVEWTPVSSRVAEKGKVSYMMIASSRDIQQMYTEDLGHRGFWDSLPLEESWSVDQNKGRHIDEL